MNTTTNRWLYLRNENVKSKRVINADYISCYDLRFDVRMQKWVIDFTMANEEQYFSYYDNEEEAIEHLNMVR